MFILIKYMLGNVYSDAHIVAKVNNNPNKINKNLTLKKILYLDHAYQKARKKRIFNVETSN